MKLKDYKGAFSTEGKILKRLADNNFRVECSNGFSLIAKVKKGVKRSFLTVGTSVRININSNDFNKGEIIGLLEKESNKSI